MTALRSLFALLLLVASAGAANRIPDELVGDWDGAPDTHTCQTISIFPTGKCLQGMGSCIDVSIFTYQATYSPSTRILTINGTQKYQFDPKKNVLKGPLKESGWQWNPQRWKHVRSRPSDFGLGVTRSPKRKGVSGK